MPVGPNGEQRPDNEVEAAIMAARILVGDLEEPKLIEEAEEEEIPLPSGEERPRGDSNP